MSTIDVEARGLLYMQMLLIPYIWSETPMTQIYDSSRSTKVKDYDANRLRMGGFLFDFHNPLTPIVRLSPFSKYFMSNFNDLELTGFKVTRSQMFSAYRKPMVGILSDVFSPTSYLQSFSRYLRWNYDLDLGLFRVNTKVKDNGANSIAHGWFQVSYLTSIDPIFVSVTYHFRNIWC